MTLEPVSTQTFSVDFPGDIEYIPPVRKFISRLINANAFSRRFTFRTEIIIDEVCNNAVKFGVFKGEDAVILTCRIEEGGVTIDVANPEGDPASVERLRRFLNDDLPDGDDTQPFRGMQIVKILCNSIEVKSLAGRTCVSIVKRKNHNEDL
ncbi:MAG: hypothetical protein A2293_11925 [Elusimicrobia bacterium RIFOXYB2_FULL_49_7]|nr:MAG: hypothetical protein A2293_11925 [Elusimicrobia bacterium RIFOXYB2_FULL_49_7]